MKTAISIVASLLLAIPFGHASNMFRGAVQVSEMSEATENLKESLYGTATIRLDPVATKGKWDNKLISDSFKMAYNTIHDGKDAPNVNWGFVEAEIEVPEDDDDSVKGELTSKRKWYSSSWLRFNYGCRLCNDDDKKSKKLLPPMMLLALESPDLHRQFEEKFCDIIREADPASFADVKTCQIDFTYSLADAWNRRKDKDHKKDKDDEDFQGEMAGEFNVHGVLEEKGEHISQARVQAMGSCFKDSYNMVHSKGLYTITDFDLEREIDVPEEDDEDSEPDQLGSRRRKYYSSSWYNYKYGCNLCAPDDDRKYVPPLVMSRLTMGEHQAFEAVFTNCLRESGVPAFAEVSDARIRFTYTDSSLSLKSA